MNRTLSKKNLLMCSNEHIFAAERVRDLFMEVQKSGRATISLHYIHKPTANIARHFLISK